MSFVRPISPALPKPVVWHRPFGGRGTWELRAAGDLVATIHYRGWARPVAVAECASGRWEFELKGWFRTHQLIRSCQNDEDVAVFRPLVFRGGGDVELPNGTRYEARMGFASSRLDLRVREGTPPFLTLRAPVFRPFLRARTQVEIAPSAASVSELPMLVCFACHVLFNWGGSPGVVIG